MGRLRKQTPQRQVRKPALENKANKYSRGTEETACNEHHNDSMTTDVLPLCRCRNPFHILFYLTLGVAYDKPDNQFYTNQ